MARAASTLLLICMLTTALVGMVNGNAATSPVAVVAPSTICKVKVSELAECIPAITGKPPHRPTKRCCSVVRKADLRCFCNHKSDFAKCGVNPANAMALPGKCGLELPKECKKRN